jgi:alpha-D-ribose 1-methylphosphonate 5-triphosphate synthase subunit PhnH
MTLAAGFADPVLDAQATFRAVLEALARPGLVQRAGAGLAPPAGLEPAAYAMTLALLDAETELWLSPALRGGAVTESLRFHCGCPLIEEPGAAAFALVGAPDAPALASFAAGDDRYPDRSTTVIWQLPALDGGPSVVLAGPGVHGTVAIAPTGLPPDVWAQWAANHAVYPRGIDLVLVAGEALIGLPRSVAVTSEG